MTLREKLESGKFIITAELSPPKGPDPRELLEKARAIRGCVDAVNLTDNNRAIVCMSSVAAARLVLSEGLEPIMQLTCRDRNRMALQSDLLGAHALGVRNMLALMGDPVRFGDHPDAKEVYDVDSLELMKTVQNLNNGISLSGKEFNGKTDFLLGAAVNPGAKDPALEIEKYRRKVDCGARFFQTQGVFEPEAFRLFIEKVKPFCDRIIAGIILLKSAKMARFLNEKVPGVHVPDSFVERLESSQDALKTGIEIAGETIRELTGISHGVHLMCIGREDLIPDMLEAAGI